VDIRERSLLDVLGSVRELVSINDVRHNTLMNVLPESCKTPELQIYIREYAVLVPDFIATAS
jgi:hypothetical protein